MAKKQGYNDEEDESLGMRTGKESTKDASMKGRRDESYGDTGTRDEKAKDKKKGSKKGDIKKTTDDYDAAAQDAAMTELGEAPMASRPLTPKRVNALAETCVMAIEELSEGQIPIDSAPVIDSEVESLPPEVWQMVNAFAQIPQMAGIEEYAFNPAEEATTDDGLLRMANKIDKMGSDKKVKRAMMAPQQGEEIVEEEVTVTPDEITDEEFSAMI